MRKLPSRLAAFFILITIFRVASFAVLGLNIGPLGYAFAVGLAAGVYACAYFIRFKETKIPAAIGLAIFVAVDLWFNEFELIRSLSTQQLLAPEADFLGMNHSAIVKGMQVSAVIYGAFPTIAAAVLGWMQSGAEKVASLKVRHWFGKFGVAIAARFESWFPETSDTRKGHVVDAEVLPDGSGNGNTAIVKARWESLSAGQKAEIAGKSDAAIIALYGGSVRRARMWRQWAREGKS